MPPSESPPPERNAEAARPAQPGEVTRVLNDAERTPAEALESVLPQVYAELRALAARTLRPGDPASVQPTDLLHEAFLRMTKERSGWDDRAHLMVAAAVAMRRTLVDHVRKKRAAKRGGDRQAIDALETIALEDRRFDTLEIEDALRRLEGEDPDAAQVAELRLFGGYDNAECADALDVSTRTVERRWRFARAWLTHEVTGAEEDDA